MKAEAIRCPNCGSPYHRTIDTITYKCDSCGSKYKTSYANTQQKNIQANRLPKNNTPNIASNYIFNNNSRKLPQKRRYFSCLSISVIVFIVIPVLFISILYITTNKQDAVSRTKYNQHLILQDDSLYILSVYKNINWLSQKDIKGHYIFTNIIDNTNKVGYVEKHYLKETDEFSNKLNGTYYYKAINNIFRIDVSQKRLINITDEIKRAVNEYSLLTPIHSLELDESRNVVIISTNEEYLYYNLYTKKISKTEPNQVKTSNNKKDIRNFSTTNKLKNLEDVIYFDDSIIVKKESIYILQIFDYKGEVIDTIKHETYFSSLRPITNIVKTHNLATKTDIIYIEQNKQIYVLTPKSKKFELFDIPRNGINVKDLEN